ncbi:hypothetical protein KSD_84230 [Ktedonobacter sp. SOSP1-85]|uniref:hypothetical protein n=1 Tax=Ktedonobacter sp. SOSP1-85 TaxID=2778367 RepID=UPI001916ACE3|nr:hypothetical protein [Ktedonobacter sp. SOSP1-85]GHO80652.1 hypothetical protein KSD_84230 [Ktedonobacter sp. SOSP1-85]
MLARYFLAARCASRGMLSDPQEWRTQLEVKAREIRQHIWEARQFLMNPTLSLPGRAQTEGLIKEMERSVSDFESRLRLSQEARAQVEARTREAESKAKHDSSSF